MSTYVERVLARSGMPPQQLVGLALVGSHSHGTYIPPTEPGAIDDIDFMGLIMPSKVQLLGLDGFDHWTERWEEMDVVLYGFHKFVNLLYRGNPNVLGLLWLQEEHYLVKTRPLEHLIYRREVFNSQQIYESFAGYAQGQLARMTSFTPEVQVEIDTLTAELAAAGWSVQAVMDGRPVGMPVGMSPEDAATKAKRLKHLRAKFHFAYMGEKRKQLVLKHGYDTKNAAHLVRLLAMCRDFLQDGVLRVFRADATMLKEIKRGEWTLEAVKQCAEELFEENARLVEKSGLPITPDRGVINELTSTIVWDYLRVG